MSGFVAENAHALRQSPAFDVQHHLSLEPYQAGMGEIEGDGNAGRALGAEPLVGEPSMRPDPQASLIQFVVNAAQTPLEPGSFNGDPEIPEA
jgi:hypothetical protein